MVSQYQSLKKLAAELSVPLTLIFNMSIKDGIVPDQNCKGGSNS